MSLFVVLCCYFVDVFLLLVMIGTAVWEFIAAARTDTMCVCVCVMGG